MATASCQLIEARINTCSCYHGLKGHLMGAITYPWLRNLPGPNSRWAFLSSAFIRDASSSNSWCLAQKPITDQSSENKCWWSFSSKWSSYIITLQGSGKVVEGRKERMWKPEEGKMCSKKILYGSGTTIALKSSAPVLPCRIPVKAWAGQHFIKDRGAGRGTRFHPFPRNCWQLVAIGRGVSFLQWWSHWWAAFAWVIKSSPAPKQEILTSVCLL